MIGFKKLFGVPRHRIYDYKPFYYDDADENAKKELRKKLMFEGNNNLNIDAQNNMTYILAYLSSGKDNFEHNLHVDEARYIDDLIDDELRVLKFKTKFSKAKEKARGNTGIGYEETYDRRMREERNIKTRVISIILILTFIAWYILS